MQQAHEFCFNLLDDQKEFSISALISAYYYSKRPHFVPRYEKYDFSQIFLILDGKGRYIAPSGKEYRILPGTMIYRPAGRSSYYEWESDTVEFGLISFVCTSPAMERFAEEPLSLHEEEAATLLDVIKTGIRVCEELKEDAPLIGMRFRPDVPRAVLGFLSSSLERFLSMVYCRLENITLLLDESQKVNSYIDTTTLVRDVKNYLASHLEEQLTISDVCTAFGISQTSMMKKFRGETACGMMEYFIDLKIKEAKHRIRHTSDSFAGIAESLGFSSPGYFSRVFKAKTGLTPTEYSRHVSKRSIALPKKA